MSFSSRSSARFLMMALLLVAGAGCGHAPPEMVVPTSHLVGGGMPVAAYPLRQEGQLVGDVDVRAGDIAYVRVRGRTHRVLHVAVTVDNDSSAPLVVPARDLSVRGLTRTPLRVATIDGLLPAGGVTIPARASRRIDVGFALPKGFEHAYANHFTLAWAVQGEGHSFEHETPFAAVRSTPAVPTAPIYREGLYTPYTVGPFAPYSPFCGGPNPCF